MNRLLCQWIDRVTIRLAATHMAKPDGRDLHLTEARHLAQSLDLSPAGAKAAGVEFDGPMNFRFASPRPGDHPVNNVVHGRLYRCDGGWQHQPVVLLLHGWNDVLNHRFFFPRHARLLNRAGISAATLQSPWHFDRRPRELGAWGNFLSADVLRTVEATLQALAEIQAFVKWLRDQGCPFVGLWGISMGAWLAGLSISHDPGIDAAALTVPVARLDRLIDEVRFCETIRFALQGQPVDLRRLSLVSNHPIIPRDHILLVEAQYDLFVDSELVEELWRAWDQPEIWRYPHGHISILYAQELPRRVARWFKAKADAWAAK